MTRANGTATSIGVPSSPGDYRLYVVDAQGNRSAESKSIARRQGGGQQGVTIVGGQSGRCVDIPGSTTTNGAQAQLWDCDGTAKQRWSHTAGRQLMVYGNKCLDANGNGTANGTAAIVWTCHGGTNQKWRLNADGSITGVQSGLCLEVAGGATANGTPVRLWTCNGQANQRWARA